MPQSEELESVLTQYNDLINENNIPSQYLLTTCSLYFDNIIDIYIDENDNNITNGINIDQLRRTIDSIKYFINKLNYDYVNNREINENSNEKNAAKELLDNGNIIIERLEDILNTISIDDEIPIPLLSPETIRILERAWSGMSEIGTPRTPRTPGTTDLRIALTRAFSRISENGTPRTPGTPNNPIEVDGDTSSSEGGPPTPNSFLRQGGKSKKVRKTRKSKKVRKIKN